MGSKDKIQILSAFADELTFDALPVSVVETTKSFIADYFAACIAGIKINRRFNEEMLAILAETGGKAESSVLFCGDRFPAEQAAFMNAVYAHGADMDDGNKKSMGHIAAHTMSAVFALAETLDVTWADVIVAINVGYEIFNRVGGAVQPGLLRRGCHSTGMAGAMACAGACAKLMGLDAEGIYSAISMAAVQSSGLLIITESGQECKPLNPANAARAGILSAKLAARGIKGPVQTLEHPKGWIHAVSDEVDEDLFAEGLGTVFTIQESYLKPYPSCRHTHCGIECALNIRKRLVDRYSEQFLDRIARIDVYIYPNAIRVAGKIIKPQNSDDAKFSIHYALSTAMVRGSFGLEDLEAQPLPGEIAQVIDKINIIVDESKENVKKGIRGARVAVLTDDQEDFASEVLVPKGEFSNPFTQEDLENKLRSCADGILTQTEQGELLFEIQTLDFEKRYYPIYAKKLYHN